MARTSVNSFNNFVLGRRLTYNLRALTHSRVFTILLPVTTLNRFDHLRAAAGRTISLAGAVA
jgi:hypothetical protein